MTDRRLLIASRSIHKLRELRELLELEETELVSLDDLGIEGDPVEDGETFETNAAIKARFGLRASGLPTLADDSGIEVDALDGGPGVRTRRYAGEDATDAANNAKLLEALRGLPAERRGARYVCVARAGTPRRRGPARRRAAHHRPRDVSWPDRHRAARSRRVRLRPDLRAGLRAARRPDAGALDAGREARHLASRPGRPADGAATRGARLPLMPIRRICVFCGASPGRDPAYLELADRGRGRAGRTRDRRRLRRQSGRA